MVDSSKVDAAAESETQSAEELARELADRLRGLANRRELTEYAVSLLRESAEDAEHAEQSREGVAKAAQGDAFNPIAFGIPLGVVGVVLCTTGILIGPGLIVLAMAGLMVMWGLAVPIFRGRGGVSKAGR